MGLIVEVSAPGRCGIIGNPSDIYGGTVVSCSIPARARCRLFASSHDVVPDERLLWDAASARLQISRPIKAFWESDIPRSSGLSGSTALLATMVACLLVVRHEQATQNTDLAELVRDIERKQAGIMCGYQDAYMVVHGGLQRMDFPGKHPAEDGPPGSLHPLPFQGPLPFLLITTGVERLSGSVHGPMSERWLAGERAVVEGMRRIGELGSIGADALTQRDWTTLADAMNENHRIVADLGGSGEAIDDLIAVCLQSGARAAKLAGAGMGGTVIALTEDPDALESRLTRLGYQRFLRPAITDGLSYHYVDRSIR